MRTKPNAAADCRLYTAGMQLLFATSNAHKIDEVLAILAPLGITVRGLEGAETEIEEPVEDQDTFEGNARLKALWYARKTGHACLADDSGLEVDALDGAPGVYSARYAGAEGDRAARDSANNAKLCAALADVAETNRTARFVCAMCLAQPDGAVQAESRGTFEGIITLEPRGENGFGYDPLLYLPDVDCTSAELSPNAKNARSHRGDATRKIAALLS